MNWLGAIDFSGLGDDGTYIALWSEVTCPACNAFKSRNPQQYTSIPVLVKDTSVSNPLKLPSIPKLSLYVNGSLVETTSASIDQIVAWDAKYGGKAVAKPVPQASAPVVDTGDVCILGADGKCIGSPDATTEPSLSSKSMISGGYSVDQGGKYVSTQKYAFAPEPPKSIFSWASGIAKSVAADVSPVATAVEAIPPSRQTPPVVASAALDNRSNDKVAAPIRNSADAVAVVKSYASSMPPAQVQQAADILVTQTKRGKKVYWPKMKRSSALPWIIGIGAVSAVALVLAARAARE